MKLTEVGNIILAEYKELQKHPFSLLHTIFKDECMICRTSENCKSLVLQGECNIKIFLSPACDSLVVVVSHALPFYTNSLIKGSFFANRHFCHLLITFANSPS